MGGEVPGAAGDGTARPARGPARRVGFALAALLGVWLVVEALVALGLWLLAAVHGIEYERLPLRGLEPMQEYVLALLIEDQHEYLAHDPVLGWTVRPHGESGLYRSNAAGMRGGVDPAPRAAPGV